VTRKLIFNGELPAKAKEKLNQHLSRAATNVTSTTATLDDDDQVILADDDTAGAAITITLPAASDSNGTIYRIKKLGTTGNVTIDGNGSETIDGSTTLVLSSQYDSTTIYCNGTSWFIID